MENPIKYSLANPWIVITIGMIILMMSVAGWRYYTVPTIAPSPTGQIEQQ